MELRVVPAKTATKRIRYASVFFILWGFRLNDVDIFQLPLLFPVLKETAKGHSVR